MSFVLNKQGHYCKPIDYSHCCKEFDARVIGMLNTCCKPMQSSLSSILNALQISKWLNDGRRLGSPNIL
ncbi:MAG: hypothetical protein ACK46O_01150 [Flavobacteriia bacterium]